MPAFSIERRKRGNFRIAFRLSGKLVRLNAGTRNGALAQRLAPKIVKAWLEGRVVTPTPSQDGRAEIFRFMAAKYGYRKPSTRRNVEYLLLTVWQALGVKNVQDVAREHWLKTEPILKAGRALKTWRDLLVTARRFFRWEVLEGNIFHDPTQGTETPPKDQLGRREAIWTWEELETVAGRVGPLFAEVLRFMWYTGMDSSDIHQLRKKHMVKDGSGAWKIVKRREKAKSDRELIDLPLASAIIPQMEARWKAAKTPEDTLFEFPYLDARSFTINFSKAVRNAWRGPNKVPKSIRHTFCTRHVERGVPIDELRRWLGHSPDSRILEAIYNLRKSSARFID